MKFFSPQKRCSWTLILALLPQAVAGLCWCFTGIGIIQPNLARAAEPPINFTDAAIYEIGEIPFFTAWEGREIKFRVRATALGAGIPVQASYVNSPSGTIYFEAGNFFYRPGPGDKAEFTVTFSASTGPSRLEQIVPIQPIPLLPPESDVLGVERKGVPDPTSRDYLVISDLREAGETPFNHANRRLRTVTVSGKELILREGHANRLWDSFNGNPDIRAFQINAEKLIVVGPFRLPATKVIIRARQIEFQDLGAQPSHISTQPLDHSIKPSQATTPGGPGLTAGDLEVYAESITLPSVQGNQPARFVMRGGAGQDGASGAPGVPGPNYKRIDPDHFTPESVSEFSGRPSTTIRNRTTGMAVDSDRNARWDIYNSVEEGDPRLEIRLRDNATRSTVNTYVSGTRWRPDGGPATAGGAPGNGGRAGRGKSNLTAALDLMDMSGGAPGTTPGYVGGPAGTPSPAYFYLATDELFNPTTLDILLERRVFQLLATHTPQPGADAPSQTGTPGTSGAKEQSGEALAWLSPQALRQVVNHAKAAYLEGEMEFVQGIATHYLGRLEQLRASPEWASVHADHQRDYALLEEELGLMSHRVTSGLDYFGNPPGWVPLLSLEVNKQVFEQEIERAIGILYLEYWLTNAGSTLQARIGALTDARKTLAVESEKMAQNFETANELLPNLEVRVQNIERETASVQNSLKELEAELLRDAKNNLKVPLWKRIARGMASVVKLIPYPAAQAIGAGLDVVANFDSSKPWESIEGAVDVVTAYREGKFDEAARDLNASYKQIRFPDLPESADPGAIKGFIDDVQNASRPIVGKLQKVQKAFQGTRVPRSQIEAELAKLKAESKEFKKLGDRISVLMVEKEAFMQQVSQTIQLLGALSEGITANLLAMDALNEDYAQAAGALDDRALMYLKEIGRRARARLLLYHYYVQKAYEYRLLRPYPSKLDLQTMFDRFLELAQQSGGTYRPLTSTEFRDLRGLFDDVLGELVREVVVEYNNNAPALSAPRRLALTTSELAQLNSGETITINLANLGGAGFFPTSEENIRITNIRVFRLGVDPVSNPQAQDEVTLYVEHSGAASVFTSAGGHPRSYRFQHYSQNTEVPVQWGGRYFPMGGDLVHISPSLSVPSLLASLLNREDTDPQNAGYFTYLGGLAELRIRKVGTPLKGANFRLNEVVLEIQYEFVRRGDTLRSLEFTTADGLAPYVELSNADLAGHKDGVGSFLRTFNRGSTVTLSAPNRIGNLRFAGFVDRNASAPGAATLLPAHFDGTNHRLSVNLASDRRIEARYVPVDELALAIAHSSGSGRLQIHLDGERLTPFKLEQSFDVQGPWLPLGEGVLNDPITVPIPNPLDLPRRFFRLSPK